MSCNIPKWYLDILIHIQLKRKLELGWYNITNNNNKTTKSTDCMFYLFKYTTTNQSHLDFASWNKS